MSNLPISDDLKRLFDDVTSGRSEPPVRAILVQNEAGTLRLVDSLPAESSDRDDFTNVLGRLFANEPTKPGYALFRLDSKSPAGLYEWLNCAFRPEGAKVREKMQYAVTQASLFQGLSEQHFLETVYGSTVADFAFPSRLRNARKHDYQNPQQPIKGKPAAEAAGTDAGGVRRNFDAVSAAARPAVVTTASSQREETKLSALNLGKSTGSTADAVQQTPPAANAAVVAKSETEYGEAKKDTPTADLISADNPAATKLETPAEEKSTTHETEDAIKTNDETDGESIPAHTSELPATENEPVANLPPSAPLTESNVAKKDEEDAAASETAPPLVSDLSPPNAVAAGLAAEVQTKPQSNGTAKSTVADEAIAASAPAPTPSLPAATQPAALTSSIGMGKGAEGLETERERQLAQVKADESLHRTSGGPRPGGPRTGFAWRDDVEPSVRKLADSEAANLVVLQLDLSKEEVQVAGEPSQVAPEQLATTLASIGTEEPLYALYAHPQAQDGPQRNLGLIYACPARSTVRQRMLYSVNLTMLSKLVDAFDGISINKRAETSDVTDLTPEYLRSTFASGETSDEAPSAAGFSRPKRPGRK